MRTDQLQSILALRGITERARVRGRLQISASTLIRFERRGAKSLIREHRKQRARSLRFSDAGIGGRDEEAKQLAQCEVTSSTESFTTSPSHPASATVSERGGIRTTTFPKGRRSTPRLRAAKHTRCPT